jgi:hypothetical protein
METVVARNSRVTERSLAVLAVGAVLASIWLARELVAEFLAERPGPGHGQRD